MVLSTWSQIEITVSIACASLPPLKSLFYKGFHGDYDGGCEATPRPCRMRALHTDSVLQDSFVPMGNEEGLTQLGTGRTIEKDIESGDSIEKTGIDIKVDEGSILS